MSDAFRRTTFSSVLVSSEWHKAGETFCDRGGHCEIFSVNPQCEPDRKALTLNLLRKLLKLHQSQYSENNLEDEAHLQPNIC